MTIHLFQKGLQSSIPNFPQKMESPAVNCLTFPNICGKSVVSSTRSWAMVPSSPFRARPISGDGFPRIAPGAAARWLLQTSIFGDAQGMRFFFAAGSTCFLIFLSTKYLCKCSCFFCFSHVFFVSIFAIIGTQNIYPMAIQQFDMENCQFSSMNCLLYKHGHCP